MDDYIRSFPKEVRLVLITVRRAIHASASSAEEAMSYGMPAFKLKGKGLVYFAAWKDHLGFYPGGPSAILAFKKELSPYKQAKGSVQFPWNKPIPYGLIKRIVKYRVKQVTGKK